MAQRLTADGTAPQAAAVLTVTGIALLVTPNHHGQIGVSGPTAFERGTGTVQVRARQGPRLPRAENGRAHRGLPDGPQQYRISARPKPLL